MDLLGLGDVHTFDTGTAWRSRPSRDRLRVPIGVAESGGSVHLDIKESAQQGMGPHGLVIGATGSGKSEFLRTLVLGLAMTHSPEHLNMVLVDFKGGATFAGMSEMPHVSAVITNLSQELTLVDRMQDALSGEMVRRQELLREAGNFASIRDYEKARAAGEDLAPMPSLFIVVDEFSEMLTAKPEFIDLFVAIGRLGRSLGLHLLLASQRLEEGRLRGLESHLSYRVGLRTFSAAESRTVLGVPDAYELPAVPGLGYLKPDQSTLLKFKAAYVSGPPSGRARVRRDEGGNLRGILPFTIAEVLSLDPAEDEVAVVARRAARASRSRCSTSPSPGWSAQGPAAHQVWLPPLDVPDTLDQLMPDLEEQPQLGLVSPMWRRLGGLTIPLGTVDRPARAAPRHDDDLADRRGRPRVGRRRPAQRQEHAAAHDGLQPGDDHHPAGEPVLRARLRWRHVRAAERPAARRRHRHPLRARRRTPHRGRGEGRRGPPRGLLPRAGHRLDRDLPRRGGPRAGPTTGTATCSSSWTAGARCAPTSTTSSSSCRRWPSAASPSACTCSSSAARWADFRSAMRDIFGTRLELRLGDPLDSEIDRKVAQLVPTGRPGRGIMVGKVHFLGALPRVDSSPDPSNLGDGIEDFVKRSAAAWHGPTGPKLRLLPARISLEAVREQAAAAGIDDKRLLLGINEKELAPVGLDQASEPHLLVLGDGQSGKSALLRSLVQEIVRTRTAKEAQIIAVDYRRSLLGEIPEDYQLDYLTSATQAGPAMKDLAEYLTNRLPGPDVTPEQLRSRSWWTGADAYVLVDDYDLVATQQGSPIHPLAPLLAQAGDIGLHLILTRRSGGASRAMYDQVIQTMRDLAMPGLMLSGSPEEGPLLGNLRPIAQPPGRGRLITRERGVETIQLAWTEPTT